MRKLNKIIAFILSILIAFTLVACKTPTETEKEKEKYTITFHTNGGSEIDTIEYTADNTNINFPISEKDGYALEGWYNNEAFGGVVYWALPSGSTGNKEYWAKWSIERYTIEYNVPDGSLPEGSITEYTKFDTVDVILPTTATREGYEFVAWYDNEELSGDPITRITAGTSGNVSVWPKWNLTEYTISFVSNGGAEIPSINYNIKSDAITLATPSREHYTFGGWFTSSSLSGDPIAKVNKGSKGNKTFYAKWVADKFEISYELNGGAFKAGEEYPSEYTVEGNVQLVSPEKVGQSFVGWFADAQFSGEPISSIAAGQTGNKKFYAKWADVQFTISYHVDGGTMPAGYPQGFNSTVGVTLLEPSRVGYNFAGWYTNADFTGIKVTAIAAGETGNKTFYAKWVTASYTVTLQANGGTGAADFLYTYGDKVSSLPRPSKQGYTFGGWFATINFTDDAVSSIPAFSTGNKTFYAKWEIVTYTLTYELNGGALSVPTSVKFTVEDTVALPIAPSRLGYTFAGWFNDGSLSVQSSGIVKGTVGNRSIYAKWTANTYTLTYQLGGGNLPSGAITGYIYNAYTILPVPTKTGFDFGGWYETENPSDPSKDKLGSLAVGAIGNKTLYALWLSPLVITNKQKMEAENTNLIGRSGPGMSGSQSDAARIQNFEGSSNGKVVGWTYGPDVYIDYEFTLDRATSNAVLTIGLGSEIGDVAFNPSNLRIYVNGKVLQWSSVRGNTTQVWFASVDQSNVTLLAGKNVITFEVLQNDLLVGFDAGGPLFDYIAVSAKANIGWTPIHY